MNSVFDFSSVRAAWHEILLGCPGTIQISAMGMALAFPIGVPGVLGRRSSKTPIAFLTRTFVEIVRNTPFLVQIYFVFFALPLIGVRLCGRRRHFAATSLPANLSIRRCGRRPFRTR